MCSLTCRRPSPAASLPCNALPCLSHNDTMAMTMTMTRIVALNSHAMNKIDGLDAIQLTRKMLKPKRKTKSKIKPKNQNNKITIIQDFLNG